MMCGTPVVATNLGAIPEIVEPGITGEIAESIDDLPLAVMCAQKLDRQKIRERAESRFSIREMAESYLQLYERISCADDPGLRRTSDTGLGL